jgi:AbrB family looped-hinge helix DNA binding protein
METEVTVGKRGRITIPAELRKKHKIKEGTRLKVIEKADGIFLKPKSIWDMIGAYPDPVTADKIDKLVYELRHEDEDE